MIEGISTKDRFEPDEILSRQRTPYLDDFKIRKFEGPKKQAGPHNYSRKSGSIGFSLIEEAEINDEETSDFEDSKRLLNSTSSSQFSACKHNHDKKDFT